MLGKFIEEILGYLNFALLLISPVIVIITFERMVRLNKIIKDKLINRRIFWTGMTVIFSFLFVEFDFFASSFSLSYEELVWLRRPIGAIAIVAFYKIIENLVKTSKKFKFDKKFGKEFESYINFLKYVATALGAILFISPFYVLSAVYDFLTALIGIFLVAFLGISLRLLFKVRKILRNPADRNFIKYISIALIIFILVPIVNVISILLNYPPSYNFFRVVLVPIYLYAFYRASKNFIEVRSDSELEDLR
ncbi:MAG: hypothetical protein QXS37_05650 [Candidatus Aenigmatarchaeota archaeon]